MNIHTHIYIYIQYLIGMFGAYSISGVRSQEASLPCLDMQGHIRHAGGTEQRRILTRQALQRKAQDPTMHPACVRMFIPKARGDWQGVSIVFKLLLAK